MNIELRPWVTPSFVITACGKISWPLREIDADTLAQLCDDFRAEVFLKAKRIDPKSGLRCDVR